MRPTFPAALALAVAACLAGCGNNGEHASPAATYQAMCEAAEAGDREALIAGYCQEARRKLARLDALADDAPDLAPAIRRIQQQAFDKLKEKATKAAVELGREEITGDEATLEITTNGKKQTCRFVKEEDGWKLVPDGLPSDEELERLAEKATKAAGKPEGAKSARPS